MCVCVCLYKIRTYASFQRYFCTDFHARRCPPLPSTGCGGRHRRTEPKAAWLICVRTSSSSFSVYSAQYPTRPCKVKEEADSGNGFLGTCCPVFSRLLSHFFTQGAQDTRYQPFARSLFSCLFCADRQPRPCPIQLPALQFRQAEMPELLIKIGILSKRSRLPLAVVRKGQAE